MLFFCGSIGIGFEATVVIRLGSFLKSVKFFWEICPRESTPSCRRVRGPSPGINLSLIHISEPTRPEPI
eukprot:380640-Pyramimonas_sp.AAC.1